MVDENQVPAVTGEVQISGGSKEIGEIFEAFESIIKSIREKKPDGTSASIPEIVMNNFEKVKSAIEGFDQLGAEVKDKAKAFPTVGFHMGKLVASL